MARVPSVNDTCYEADAEKYLDHLLSDGEKIPVDTDTDSYTIELPKWFDEKKFKRAQKFFYTNVFAIFVGNLAGLLAILSVPSILKILIHTKNSGTVLSAYRRYLATVYHTFCWYDFKPKKGSKLWDSLTEVRKKHITSSKYCCSKGAGMITQKDMAITQFGFMGFIIIKAEQLGIQMSHEEVDAFIHFWRTIGYMLGIKNEYNVCTSDIEVTKQRLNIIMDKVLKKNLEINKPEFISMASYAINGLWCFNPFLYVDTFLFITKRLANCTGYYYYQSEQNDYNNINNNNEENINKILKTNPIIDNMSPYLRFVINSQMFVHKYLLKIFIFRWYFNFQMILAKFIITYFPFLAIFKFGFKDSYVRICKDK